MAASLWALAWLGSMFSAWTLALSAYVLAFTLPALYNANRGALAALLGGVNTKTAVRAGRAAAAGMHRHAVLDCSTTQPMGRWRRDSALGWYILQPCMQTGITYHAAPPVSNGIARYLSMLPEIAHPPACS